MSRKHRSRAGAGQSRGAHVFAAPGDETRLRLVVKLCDGRRYSIAQLTQESKMTRQSVTKHLQVLENVGMVRGVRAGREMFYEFDAQPIEEMKFFLDAVSQQWDVALTRLKEIVEKA